jgi:hypothetical protein
MNKTYGDGSMSLTKESRWGHAVQFLVSSGALALAEALNMLDVSALPQWSIATVSVAIGTAVGLLTSYAKKNR